MLTMSVYNYAIGFHNMDIGQNMRYLETELNIELYDVRSDFSNISARDSFINGTNTMEDSFFKVIIASAGIGFALSMILSLVHVQNKRSEVKK